eukprot:CAMPEP_0180170218 /NCGR_PEP_ID=MMETSP0986-20121125/33705_1 /TAXON_ID=697907 /ORGANISM="non described non described, Strain CCMP2293" /LENGTH=66 /DNA_ID=CAMNT_0022121885 /DNA_START=26 /DNA_END=223 /DNA_ORIENTATION=+
MGDSEDIRETLKKAREALFKADAPSVHYQGSTSVVKDDPPNGGAGEGSYEPGYPAHIPPAVPPAVP